MRRGSFTSLCALLVWMGGCPKRQDTKNVVVYVPAQPPPAVAPAAKSQVLVIEEPPPPPEPEETAAPGAPEATPAHRPRHVARPETASEPDQTSTQEIQETPPAVVPALEPRQSSAQETELRRQFANLEQDFHRRLARLNAARLSANDQRTLEDARAFFLQATRARESGDLPRALNLVRKAGLLLAALE